MKEHRNCAVRAKEKKLGRKGEEKMLYIKMHYLNLVVWLVAQREGLIFYNRLQKALPLPIYSSLIFCQKKLNNFTNYMDFEDRKNKAQRT